MKDMFALMFYLCVPIVSLAQQSKEALPIGTVVVPLILDPSIAEDQGWVQGGDIWIEVAFLESPQGPVLFWEPAEKVWWIGGTPVLFLGAAGNPVPQEISNRGMSWVRLYHAGEELDDSPLTIKPRRDRVRLGPDNRALEKVLTGMIPGVDAAYLAQIANFLAGNLADLDIQGTSYSISGYGTVIGPNGEWSGEALDFDKLDDMLTIDAFTTFDQDTNNADLEFDAGTFFIDASMNRVGIGTVTPGERLDVAGNIHATGTLSSGNSVRIDGTNDSITASGGILDFDDEFLQTSGNVGIGIAVDPSRTLRLAADSTRRALKIESIDGTRADINFRMGDREWFVGQKDPAGSFDFFMNDLTTPANSGSALFFDGSNLRVGIGTPTPGEKLDVGGNIHASGTITSDNSIVIDGTTDSITASGGTLDFDDEFLQTSGSAGIGTTADPSRTLRLVADSTRRALKIETFDGTRADINFRMGDREWFVGQLDTTGSFDFFMNDLTTPANSGSAIFVDGTNLNVGLGTTSPNERLEVNGNIIAADPTSNSHVTTKLYVDTEVAKKSMLKTGTYVGDGAATQTILGLGFQPNFVILWPATHNLDTECFKTDQDIGNNSHHDNNYNDMCILTLDSDGFTVSGAGNYNDSGKLYVYAAFH